MGSNTLRVRCAPSPTGTLHLGNCKTFIFNYLFAKKYDADFLLRIEDTDKSREIENGAENILKDLKWLGLMPNMGYGSDSKPAGVYKQTERLHIYQEYANKLLKEGKAYKCYCSQVELDKKREEALAKDPKNPFKYPGTCLYLKGDLDKDYIIRLKTPKEGFTEVEDITFGKRNIPNKENYDFAIMRSNGIPLFGFANVIDDGIIDEVTNVIRGADHYVNMVQHLLIYKALDLKPPVFTHLPILRNKNNGKLSKRDGSVSVAEFREQGYSPNAIINYLVKFGWSHKDQELFTVEDLIEKFALEDCHNKDGKFDTTKFAVINYEHLKSTSLTPDIQYSSLLKPFIDRKNIGEFTEEQLIPFVQVVRSRAKTFVEAATMIEPMLKETVEAEAELIQKTFTQQNAEYLRSLNNDVLSSIESWNEDSLRFSVQGWLKNRQLSLKDVGSVLRVSLLGTNNSPELFQVLSVMGKEKSTSRINKCLAQLA